MRPLTPADKMQPRWVDNRSTAEVADSIIKPNDRLTSFERLEIYNRQYWFRLLDCLLDDHPGLCAVVGTTRFYRLAGAYLTECPSRSPELSALGDRLPRFIRENPKLTHPHTEMAAQMAMLERAQIEAFDAFALPSLDAGGLSRLGATPPDRIFLGLQPHITLLELSWPLDRLVIRVLRQQDSMRAQASNAMEIPSGPARRSIANKIALSPEAVQLVVHRADNTIYFKRLTLPQFRVLQAFRDGANLADACAVLQDLEEAADLTPGDIQMWFQNWASMGFLTDQPVKKRKM